MEASAFPQLDVFGVAVIIIPWMDEQQQLGLGEELTETNVLLLSQAEQSPSVSNSKLLHDIRVFLRYFSNIIKRLTLR